MSALAATREYPQPTESGILTKPLASKFVAEISGLDLAEPQSERTIAELRAALIKYKLLVFRGQALTPREQRNLAARFGSLHVHPLIENLSAEPEIIVLEHDEVRPLKGSNWHTDVTFIETPPLASILHAIVVPDTGGDTIFADLGAAHAALSAPLRQFLKGLRASHDFAKSFHPDEIATPEYGAKWNATRASHAPVSHPVVRTHPESGEQGLFVNEGFTVAVEGLAADESAALLEFLFRHSRKPEFTYRHHWRAGDVLFWDNRITQHYAVADYWPQRRRMHRATIIGDRPV